WQFIVANTDTTTPGLSYAIGTAPGTAPTLGAWTFLVGVYDAGSQTATLYVNGINAGHTGVSSTVNDNASATFRMGKGMYNFNSGNVYYWPGNLSQVQVWANALTQAQVQALYQHAN